MTSTATGPAVVVVIGPRAAERVHQLRRPGEPIADQAAILRAVDPDNTGGEAARKIAHAAWCGLVDRARVVAGGTVWIVHPDPTPAQLTGYRERGYLVASPRLEKVRR